MQNNILKLVFTNYTEFKISLNSIFELVIDKINLIKLLMLYHIFISKKRRRFLGQK